jgi:acetyl-CoA synthase
LSKIIASAAIRGAHKIVARAEEAFNQAVATYGSEAPVAFPNTGYYLPVIYGITGMVVEKLGDLKPVLDKAKSLLPPVPTEKVWLPYLGPTLDAGMATLFADEVIEAAKYVENPPYTMTSSPTNGNLWLGAADDVIMRKRAIEFVDGTAPGFAAIVGAAPTNEIAVKIARELQEKNLYVFMSAASDGRNIAEQLAEEGVELGWETRLVSFGKDITATVFSLGFAARAAMSFGGVKPGDFRRLLLYNKNRIFAFVLALGEVDDEKYAQAAGAINFGFPTIADTDIPEILPTGVCTYEHVVSRVPHDKIVSRAIEVRGLKIAVTKVPIPVSFGPAFEGETVRKGDMQAEFGGQKTPAFEVVRMQEADAVEDGRIELVGPDVDTVPEGGRLPLGIVVDVYGRKMQEDFEPVIERRVHYFINYAQGVWHMGQRDLSWVRISRAAFKQGFRMRHFGDILYAKIKSEFANIVDRVQVTIYTDEAKVIELRENSRQIYARRDARLKALNDDTVDTFYSCTLCQSFAPTHVCIVLPERVGLCGSVSWLDAKAAFEINPHGCNYPIPKKDVLDPEKGQWQTCNDLVYQNSRGAIEKANFYTIMEYPLTSCGCFEAIIVMLPECNGFMIVNREYRGMTPCGMTFSTLAGTIGGGIQTPGFMGIGKAYLASKKFVVADGGLARVVWLPKEFKDQMRPVLEERAEELGLGKDFVDKIADETVGVTAEEILPFLLEKGHPALTMAALL